MAIHVALAKKGNVDNEEVMVRTAGIEGEEVAVEEGAEETAPEDKLLSVECRLTMMNKVLTHNQEPKTRNGRNCNENSQEPQTVNRMLPITREKQTTLDNPNKWKKKRIQNL